MCRQMKTVYRDIMFVTDIMDEGVSSCAVICSILIHLTYRGLFEHQPYTISPLFKIHLFFFLFCGWLHIILHLLCSCPLSTPLIP